jgi:DnaJ-class molecular chaperone
MTEEQKTGAACPTCRGFGYRVQTTKWDWFSKVSNITCPDCNGSGKEVHGE